MRSVGRFFLAAAFLYFLATGCLRFDQQRLATTAARIAATLATTNKEPVSSSPETAHERPSRTPATASGEP